MQDAEPNVLSCLLAFHTLAGTHEGIKTMKDNIKNNIIKNWYREGQEGH